MLNITGFTKARIREILAVTMTLTHSVSHAVMKNTCILRIHCLSFNTLNILKKGHSCVTLVMTVCPESFHLKIEYKTTGPTDRNG